jgi:hypothetical protein
VRNRERDLGPSQYYVRPCLNFLLPSPAAHPTSAEPTPSTLLSQASLHVVLSLCSTPCWPCSLPHLPLPILVIVAISLSLFHVSVEESLLLPGHYHSDQSDSRELDALRVDAWVWWTKELVDPWRGARVWRCVLHTGKRSRKSAM